MAASSTASAKESAVKLLLACLWLGALIALGCLLLAPLQAQFQAFQTEHPRITRDAWMKLQPILRGLGLNALNPNSLGEMLIAVAGAATLFSYATGHRKGLKATGISMATISIITTMLLWAIGIPYFLLLGIAAGFFEIVPFFGPMLAFIGPFLIALSISLPLTLWVIASSIVVQILTMRLAVFRKSV